MDENPVSCREASSIWAYLICEFATFEREVYFGESPIFKGKAMSVINVQLSPCSLLLVQEDKKGERVLQEERISGNFGYALEYLDIALSMRSGSWPIISEHFIVLILMQRMS